MKAKCGTFLRKTALILSTPVVFVISGGNVTFGRIIMLHIMTQTPKEEP